MWEKAVGLVRIVARLDKKSVRAGHGVENKYSKRVAPKPATLVSARMREQGKRGENKSKIESAAYRCGLGVIGPLHPLVPLDLGTHFVMRT